MTYFGDAPARANGHLPPFKRRLSEAETWRARADYGPGATEREEVEPDVRLSIIDPTEWHGRPVPEREWCVPGLIPAGTVSTITGDGAAGKSTLMLQLAVARSLGQQWLGMSPSEGRTLVLSAEDDRDELHRRADAIVRHYGVGLDQLGALSLVDLVGEEAVLAALNRQTNTMTPTALYQAVARHVELSRPDLVIIDSLADAFAGQENDRQHARQFIGLLKRLCRNHDLTVIVIAHPSVSGMQSGTGSSGSTAWNNSVRSRLYFETDKGGDGRDPDPDLRTLTTKKANYGRMGGEIRCRYQAGAFVPVEQGGTLDAMARDNRADRAFIELLRLHLETGQDVSPKQSPTHAPTLFARHPKADGVTKRDFAAAMQRHLEARRITIETSGSPSRRYSRLIVVEAT